MTGKVTAFRFTNPHGTIALDVTKPDGTVEHWQRRDQRAGDPHPARLDAQRDQAGRCGDHHGWPARNGANYMRLSGMRDANGKADRHAPFGRQDQS